MLPPTKLGVVIRDATRPLYQSPRYREVTLLLTDEQRQELSLQTGECVDGCFLRPAGKLSRHYYYVNDGGRNGLARK